MRKLTFVLLAALAALVPALPARAGSFDQLLDKNGAAVPPPPPAPVVSGAAPVESKAPAAAEREWLVMVFINGVNDLGILGYANKSVNDMEKVGSTDKMTVLVELGALGQDGTAGRGLQFQRGANTYLVGRDNDAGRITSRVVFSSPEADMGSAAHLVTFAKRGLRKYPAKKVMLVLWNHGSGRLGISYDDVSKNHMEVDQLAAALGQLKTVLGRKLDVFATDACLMQMAAVAYEFRNAADTVVGSEEVIPGDSYPYDRFLAKLAADPAMGGETLARHMVDDYGAYYGTGVTLSAVRSGAQAAFVNLLNAWVGALMGDPAAMKKAAAGELVDSVQQFSMSDSKDLYDYILKVEAELPAAHPGRTVGKALRDHIKKALLARATALPGMTDAHGLAVYIPERRYNTANYEKMAFAADSDWDDFLRLMMEERLKE